jgi:neuropeptide S receptor 1
MCWSLFFVYNLLELYGLITQNDPLSTFINSAAPLNSAANPIIYGIFSTRICRNLR